MRATIHAYAPGLIDRFPRIRVGLGGWVPGWTLRLLVVGIAAACLQLLRPVPEVWALYAFALLALLLVPGRMLPALIGCSLGLLLIVGGSPVEAGRTAWLTLGLPTLAVLGAVAGQAGPRARVELAALAVPVRRVVALQLVAQPIALLASLVSGARLELPLLPVLAVLGLAVLVLAWAPSLSQTPGTEAGRTLS